MRTLRALLMWVMVGLAVATVAQAATPEVSTTNRLQDRRAVTAGDRAYAVGFADGRFYAHGWHISGEMGGIWTPPMKMVDGVWFGVGGEWVGRAQRFSTGYGYTRYELPDAAGLHLERTDFAPDGRRALLIGLKLSNPGSADRTVPVRVQAHSELMGAYPWGFGGVTPNASENIADHGAFADGALRFTDDGALSQGPAHHYAALVAADRAPTGGEAAATGGAYRGPQGNNTCQESDRVSLPSNCDDGPYGRGTGGELRYDVKVPAGGSETLWVAVAGSDDGVAAAQKELAAALDDPAGQLADKIAGREALAAHTQLSLPGDERLQRAIDWGKQNLADLTQSATDLQIRWTNQGKQFPPPLGTVPQATWFGAGFPDYPWIFATDGEYTTFAALALGQFETAEQHLRALRDISDILNNRSGVVVHESVQDGSIWFGHDSQNTAADGTKTNNFNTDEIVKFPSIVALVWRWTGDDGFRREMYDFSKRNLRYVDQHLDEDHDGWPEGSGNVERPGMGHEKLDNAVYYLRSLLDLVDMARAKHDAATARWAAGIATRIARSFEGTWWSPALRQYVDSLDDPGNTQKYQGHWIDQVPMEAELTFGTSATPGLAVFDRGNAALAKREDPCFSGERPGNLGLYHTACGGGADGKGDFEIFSLTTSIQSVGEGNYGRLGPGAQQRYTDALAEPMFGQPATGGEPDEQPGAMPEIFPSTPSANPTAGIPPNIDRCWICRSMSMQAWGNYGTAWPVVHQQLGVRPFLNEGELQVVPQVPPGQPSVEGRDIRLGDGSADVAASHAGATYTTKADASAAPVKRLVIGHTLPRDARVATVTLDGKNVKHYDRRRTNRGLEITVPTKAKGAHTLVVTAAG